MTVGYYKWVEFLKIACLSTVFDMLDAITTGLSFARGNIYIFNVSLTLRTPVDTDLIDRLVTTDQPPQQQKLLTPS